MKFFKMMKAAVLIGKMFSDEEKIKELIDEYFAETGLTVTVEEVKANDTEKVNWFAEWVSEKVIAEL